jgi:hypothetical protein
MACQVTVRNGGGSNRVVVATVKDPTVKGKTVDESFLVVEPGDTSNTVDVPIGMYLEVYEEVVPPVMNPT